MTLFSTLKVALRAIGRNKMRSGLTMLGIIIGVGAVIAMVAIGQGASATVRAQIASLGTNMLMVMPGSSGSGGVRWGSGSVTTLTSEDSQAIGRECPAVAHVSAGVRTVAQVVFGNQNWSTSIFGGSEQYLDVKDWPMESGSYFTASDVRAANKVCVIGKTVEENLFQGMDAAGQIIRVKRIPFRVLGVLTRKGQTSWGQDQDDVVIMPHTTAQKKILGITHVNMIMVSATAVDMINEASRQITALLRQRHRLQFKEDNDFTIRTQNEIASAAETTSKVMSTLLASIASVSLIVGGIGIMNIMLVSVTERTREIGIRMAVGARGRDILFQFLVESVVLSAIGGAIGVGLGLYS
ncbi:MAG: FtsX-like permease family protein, partial [Planctomycetes bacterium]|nr:FtsX-like permease family protein [Planctomycetota bacterium]